jgi:ABC-type glycerol-3-phosphate transport system permease component
MTAPVALSRFLSAYATEWGPMMAATMTITIPLVIIMIVLRKHVITGLTLGAVK